MPFKKQATGGDFGIRERPSRPSVPAVPTALPTPRNRHLPHMLKHEIHAVALMQRHGDDDGGKGAGGDDDELEKQEEETGDGERGAQI